MLSSRGLDNVQQLGLPWRFSPTPTYDPESNPTGLISFALAENRPMREEIVKYINQKVEFTLDSVSYRSSAKTTGRLPAAAAAHMSRIMKTYTPIEPEHVITADCPTSLGSMLGYNLAERGEGILVNRPVYGRFELDYGVEAGVQIVYADTATEEAFTPSAVDKYEQALTAAEERGVKIRAVLLVNPHNPVGRCYPEETLREIARFCNEHKLHLISDEVYASTVFETDDPTAVPFTSLLALDLRGLIDLDLVHVLYGFSKDFASGGLHLGFLISQNEHLRQACKMVMRLHSPSQVAVTIGTAILEDQVFVSSFIKKTRERLAAGYRLVTSKLDQEGITYIKGGNAGFFVYIDLSPFLPDDGVSVREREFALAQKLVDAGVFLHPGEEHSKDAGWFRLVFSHDENTLEEGLRRLLSVLKPTGNYVLA
ncbi:uncharacterized protein N7482_003596 [Penicillium canariense]|uniref:Aminotransferase class I/classII large domain-containing protein n=1 Tax=Penicillium canariense TaxID=189055 RepID=A0A9W9IAP4_9EURO|nr:uncharacterized protein N7482_003596 [Penicillium canariense]KAJ5168002.1 hypothetical protein N7482_003596 [Penicillium canariense]